MGFICTRVKTVGFVRQSSFFLLFSQKKETKEKATPSRSLPVLLTIMGGNRKLATLKQPLTENSHNDCAARRGSKGVCSYFPL
jgi:hypothetical protein